MPQCQGLYNCLFEFSIHSTFEKNKYTPPGVLCACLVQRCLQQAPRHDTNNLRLVCTGTIICSTMWSYYTCCIVSSSLINVLKNICAYVLVNCVRRLIWALTVSLHYKMFLIRNVTMHRVSEYHLWSCILAHFGLNAIDAPTRFFNGGRVIKFRDKRVCLTGDKDRLCSLFVKHILS